MRTIRFLHRPSQTRLLIGPQGVLHAVRDELTSSDALTQAWAGLQPDEWLRVGEIFEELWLWPAPGTRFPPSNADLCQGRLNIYGADGDLTFEGYLDARELAALQRGQAIPARRTELERHLTAFDYRLRGVLGFRDLYRAFRGSLMPWYKSALKAFGALLVFGRGRPVVIADIARHRAADRTGGYDRDGNLDEAVLRQFEPLFTGSEEVDQARLRRFIALNFLPGRISKSQWESFFETCRALNQRATVTHRQLRSLFEGSFNQLAASRVDARGRRLLEQLLDLKPA